MKKFFSIFFASFFAFCFLTNINFNIAKAQTIKEQEQQQVNEFESSALSFVVIEEGNGLVTNWKMYLFPFFSFGCTIPFI